MAQIRFYIKILPGAFITMASHPTEIDTTGCDGLYAEAVHVVDAERFQLYCDHMAVSWFKFSLN